MAGFYNKLRYFWAVLIENIHKNSSLREVETSGEQLTAQSFSAVAILGVGHPRFAERSSD
jgi:hypothetical protein